jgi:hypothetical protein
MIRDWIELVVGAEQGADVGRVAENSVSAKYDGSMARWQD